MIKRNTLAKLVAITAVVSLATSATQGLSAPLLEIQMSGVNIGYDGSSIFDQDPGSSDPDPLSTVSFLLDGTSTGSVLTSDIFLDLSIPDVLNINPIGGTVLSGTGGLFDLTMPGGDFVSLILGPASVTYVDAGFVEFAFVGSVAQLVAQSLPYGLELDDPVSVSFSTQIIPGSLSTSTFVDSFTASGTGEIRSEVPSVVVPEPSSLALVSVAFMLLAACRRIRRRS